MRAFILAISLLIAVLPGVSHSIEISPDEPIAFKEELIRKPPVGTSDVMEYWWYPKYDLCMSLEMATSGILKYFPKVNRLILPRDNPGFYAKSTDGLMSLHVAGPEDRIKKIAVHDIPFCINASRFSMGNWSDADPAIEIITGMIIGLSSYSSQSDARNKALDIVRQILSNPWEDRTGKNRQSTDGCVDFDCQHWGAITNRMDDCSLMTISCSERSLNVSIHPPKK